MIKDTICELKNTSAYQDFDSVAREFVVFHVLSDIA